MTRRAPSDRSCGFSLVEMLVCLAILGLLAAILLPWLGSVRAKFGRVGCLNNLRTLGVAIQAAAADNNGELPLNEAPRSATNLTSLVVWYEVLAPYAGYTVEQYNDPAKIKRTPLICPSETDYRQAPYYGYSMNIDLNYRLNGEKARVRLGGLQNMSRYVLLSDSFRSHILYTANEQRMRDWTQVAKRHGGHPNFLYADGHAASFDGKLVGYLEASGAAEREFYYNLYYANGLSPYQR